MNFLHEILSDTENNKSMMRVMSLLSLVIGCVIGVVGLFMCKDLTGVATLAAVFVGAAFAGKVGQKAMEEKE